MNITIERFDPAVDAAPYTTTYEVPWRENFSVLECLMYIHENLAPVTFDYACRGGLCGRCAMQVDGKPAFGCFEFLSDEDHLIQPLPGFPVIRDLIVDKRRAQQTIAKVYDRVRAFPLTQEEIMVPNGEFTAEVADKLHKTEYCCRCQVCTSGCPAKAINPMYVGPSQMVATAFRFIDPWDQADRVLEAVRGGLWDCLMCGRCDELCQNHEIKHVELFQMLRDAAEERGLVPAK